MPVPAEDTQADLSLPERAAWVGVPRAEPAPQVSKRTAVPEVLKAPRQAVIASAAKTRQEAKIAPAAKTRREAKLAPAA
jgi:hypothetical protein